MRIADDVLLQRSHDWLEVHNGLGVVYMRMGQYSDLLHKDAATMWQESERHYQICLQIQPTLTPTLQNLGTLHRLQGELLRRCGNSQESDRHFKIARGYFVTSLRINQYDQFPHYGPAVCPAYLGDWNSAHSYVRSGRKQHGRVRKELWDKLAEAVSQEDSALIATEESGES